MLTFAPTSLNILNSLQVPLLSSRCWNVSELHVDRQTHSFSIAVVFVCGITAAFAWDRATGSPLSKRLKPQQTSREADRRDVQKSWAVSITLKRLDLNLKLLSALRGLHVHKIVHKDRYDGSWIRHKLQMRASKKRESETESSGWSEGPAFVKTAVNQRNKTFSACSMAVTF